MSNDDDMFDEVELSTPSNTATGVQNVIQSPVSPTDSQWTDWVMDQFEEGELDPKGHPLVHGLRRVAELILGEIVESGPTQVFPATTPDHYGRATVVFKIRFASGHTYSEVADSWGGNTDDAFAVFPAAMASTRAEGRALRKALKLKKGTAEEMTYKDTASVVDNINKKTESKKPTDGGYSDNTGITTNQWNFIDIKCRQLNIDGTKFLNAEFEGLEMNMKMTKSQASSIIDRLVELQNGSEKVPEDLLGYQTNWRVSE